MGSHTLKTYSKQQKVVALSSAEAELYAMVAASTEAMAMQSYARDLGVDLKSELYTDSSAALGIAKRAGIGKVRHLRTQGLWIQEVRVSGRISYKKVLGEKNPADLLTKYMPSELASRHLECISASTLEGRAETAPELDQVDDGRHDDDFETRLGDVISVVRWIRDKSERRTRFNEIVRVRPIPASGKMRQCTKKEGSKLRGSWPAGARPQKVARYEDDEDVKSIEGKINEKMIREECGDIGLGSHEPQGEFAHTCGMDSRERWADMDRDGECEACRRARLALEAASHKAVQHGGALESVEIEESAITEETDYVDSVPRRETNSEVSVADDISERRSPRGVRVQAPSTAARESAPQERKGSDESDWGRSHFCFLFS